MCLRTSRMPLSGPMWTQSSSAWRRSVAATCPSVGGVGQRPTGERRLQVAEQPRPAQAAPSDHDAVAPGLGDHGERVRRAEDVAVAQHGQLGRQRVAQPGDRGPVGRPRVALRRRARVQGDGRDPGVGGDPAGLEVGAVLVVDPDPHLDGDGHRPGVADRGAHDPLEQPPLVGQRRPAAAPRDLGDRAAEVEVDVVGQVVARRPCAPRPRPSPGRRRRAAASAGARRRRRRSCGTSAGCARPGRGT